MEKDIDIHMHEDAFKTIENWNIGNCNERFEIYLVSECGSDYVKLKEHEIA